MEKVSREFSEELQSVHVIIKMNAENVTFLLKKQNFSDLLGHFIEDKLNGIAEKPSPVMLQVGSEKFLTDTNYSYDFRIADQPEPQAKFKIGEQIRVIDWDYDVKSKKLVIK